MRSLKESLLNDEDDLVGGLDKKSIIESWLLSQKVTSYKLLKNLDIVVNQACHIILSDEEEELPQYINFSWAKHNFTIVGKSLKTLRGCPKRCSGHFVVALCPKITSTIGVPQNAYSLSFLVCDNLSKIEGLPNQIRNSIRFEFCPKLKSLKGCPKIVGNGFRCIGCDGLENLEGCPEVFTEYNSSVVCSYCDNLKSLKKLPSKFFSLSCHDCPKLTKEGFMEGEVKFIQNLYAGDELKHPEAWSHTSMRYSLCKDSNDKMGCKQLLINVYSKRRSN